MLYDQENEKWHSRGYLPHKESAITVQMITYRLNDALPKDVTVRLAQELEPGAGENAYRQRIEKYLDEGYGSCLLENPINAKIIIDSLKFFDGERYQLIAWVVMPNHVHVMVKSISPFSLSDTIRGWKSFTARLINKNVGSAGTLWQKEYWDRYIRNETHFDRALDYIHNNPVKARLVNDAKDWDWSSAKNWKKYNYADFF